MSAFSILVSLALKETGPRANDGNFGWGIPFFSYLLFVTGIVYLIALKKRNMIKDEEFLIGRILYILHIIFGVFYIGLMLMGYLSWEI